jgi:hypothetical protein
MKDSRQLREVAATFVVGGLSIVVLKYAVAPTVEKQLRAKAR